MTVLIIEWSGLDGIAEATRSWYVQGREVGRHCTVITTLGGVLEGADVVGIERGRAITGYTHQVELVQLAVEYIRRHTPKVVVLQGYALPHEEQRVITAARAVGARVVLVVYMPKPPFLSVRTSVGLRKLLRSADVLVAHADNVAAELRPRGDQRVVQAPFPPFEMSAGSLGSPSTDHPVPEPVEQQLVLDVDAASKSDVAGLVDAFGADGSWSVVVPDAPRHDVALATQRSWLDTVGASRAALVPSTSPFGNVMTSVAMGLGVVPVVRDIGAQAEQIGRGTAGILVPADATPRDWVALCDQLRDDEFVEDKVAKGFDLIDEQAAAFAAAARDVLS